MLEQFMSLLRESSQDAIVQNPEVPNEHNEAVMQEAAGSLQTGLQQIYQTHGASGVKQLFESAEANRTDAPEVQQVSQHFADNITNKLGIPKGSAMSMAMAIIPMLLRNMMRKGSGKSNGGFDLGSILGSVLGGGGSRTATPGQKSSGGLMGNLSNIGASLGLDKDKDGDVDLNDLMSMFGKKDQKGN